jgi:hypothetical protein
VPDCYLGCKRHRDGRYEETVNALGKVICERYAGRKGCGVALLSFPSEQNRGGSRNTSRTLIASKGDQTNREARSKMNATAPAILDALNSEKIAPRMAPWQNSSACRSIGRSDPRRATCRGVLGREER